MSKYGTKIQCATSETFRGPVFLPLHRDLAYSRQLGEWAWSLGSGTPCKMQLPHNFEPGCLLTRFERGWQNNVPHLKKPFQTSCNWQNGTEQNRTCTPAGYTTLWLFLAHYSDSERRLRMAFSRARNHQMLHINGSEVWLSHRNLKFQATLSNLELWNITKAKISTLKRF